MALKTLGIAIIIISMTISCAAPQRPTRHIADPPMQTIETEHYRISFKPLKKDGNFFVAFLLEVQNKAAGEIEVDWNRTHYLLEGKNHGKFVFAGIPPADVKAGTVPPDKIESGNTLQREIAPQQLLAYAAIRDKNVRPGKSGISAGPLPEGRNGIHLVLSMEGKDYRQNLILYIEGTD